MDANRKVTKKRDSINLPLNYSQALRMIFDLKIQIDALKKNNKAFIEKAPDNVIENFRIQEQEMKSSIEKINEIINTIN